MIFRIWQFRYIIVLFSSEFPGSTFLFGIQHYAKLEKDVNFRHRDSLYHRLSRYLLK